MVVILWSALALVLAGLVVFSNQLEFLVPAAAAFAVASLLALLAVVTLVIKSVVEWRHAQAMKAVSVLPPERLTPETATA